MEKGGPGKNPLEDVDICDPIFIANFHIFWFLWPSGQSFKGSKEKFIFAIFEKESTEKRCSVKFTAKY